MVVPTGSGSPMQGPAAARAPGGTGTAIVVAGDEETRVLLRGLLRLHHIRVSGEASGTRQGLQLVETHHPTVLVADVNLSDGSFADLLAASRRADPKVRIILVVPTPRSYDALDGARPDAVLHRPFRIREFAEALALGTPGGAAGPPTGG